MKQKLSQLNAPALAGVVKEKSTKAAIAEINNCVYDGADMIDLHLSCLENTETDELKKIITFSKLPVLARNYNTTYEGKNAGYSEDDRAELFLRAVEAGAAGIDMQGYTFHFPSKKEFFGENGRCGTPKDIADAVLFLAYQDYITGENIVVDGGRTLGTSHR